MIKCARHLPPPRRGAKNRSFSRFDSQTALPMREVGACKPGGMVGGVAAFRWRLRQSFEAPSGGADRNILRREPQRQPSAGATWVRIASMTCAL